MKYLKQVLHDFESQREESLQGIPLEEAWLDYVEKQENQGQITPLQAFWVPPYPERDQIPEPAKELAWLWSQCVGVTLTEKQVDKYLSAYLDTQANLLDEETLETFIQMFEEEPDGR